MSLFSLPTFSASFHLGTTAKPNYKLGAAIPFIHVGTQCLTLLGSRLYSRFVSPRTKKQESHLLNVTGLLSLGYSAYLIYSSPFSLVEQIVIGISTLSCVCFVPNIRKRISK